MFCAAFDGTTKHLLLMRKDKASLHFPLWEGEA